MGDIIASSAIVTAFRKAGFSVTFVCFDRYSEIAHNIGASSVVTVSSKTKLATIMSLIRFTAHCMFNRYFLCFCFHRRANIFQWFCLFSFAKFRFGFSDSKLNLYNKSSKYDILTNRTVQEINLVKKAGLPLSFPRNLFFKSSGNFQFDINSSKKFITVSLGGGNFLSPIGNRQWPVEHYISLMKALVVRFEIVLVGSGSQDEIISRMVEEKVHVTNFVGKLTVGETAEIISSSVFFIGNDSGLSYVAAGVGATTIVLFGPTSPRLALPYGDNCFALSGEVKCQPCYDPKLGKKSMMYLCNKNICMQNLLPEDVINQINIMFK